jgi:hypothetical protein
MNNEQQIENRKALLKTWQGIHPVDRPDWESFKRGTWKGRKLNHIWALADMADRERRAKEWSAHLAQEGGTSAAR